MKQFKRILCAVLADLMLALTLSACNGATGGKLKSDSDGSVLKINLASEPDYLDPALSSAVDSGTLATNSFVGLFTTDSKGKIVPALVDKYEVSPDGLLYTFHLKKGLRWSDGSPLTAADFEYSWKRAADPNTGAVYSYLYDALARDKKGVIDAKAKGNVFRVRLAAPCAYFLSLCAFPTFYPVPKKAVEKADPERNNPGKWCSEAGFITDGAYTLKEWKHNESMIYEKNPYFYNADKVKVKELQFMLSADSSAAYSAYNAGDLDFCDSIPNDLVAAVQKRPDFFKQDTLGTYYIAFNVDSDLFKGMSAEKATAVRHALSVLIDREYIVKNIGQTGQEIATSFVPPGMSDGNGKIFKSNDEYDYPDKESVGFFPAKYNAAAAKKEAISILKGVGYRFTADGKLSPSTPISFDYAINSDTGHQAIAEALQSDWGQIGVRCRIRTEEWNTFLADRRAGKLAVSRDGWVADFDDPITMLDLFTSDSLNNDCLIGRDPINPAEPRNWGDYDKLIAQAKSTNDMAERVKILHEAEAMVMSTYAAVPIYFYNDVYLCKTNVKGIYCTPFNMKFFMYSRINPVK